jgi:hypothetical protein
VLVRSVVITYLHQGLLFSNDLIVRPWDSHTRVVRALYNKREALQVSLSSQESARHVLFRPCSLAQ